MLPSKYIAFLVFVWITCSLFGAILEGSYLGSTEQGVLNQVMFWQTVTTEEDWGFLEIVGAVPGFAQGVFDMLTFRFSFLDSNEYEIVRWIAFGPIVATFVYGMIMTVIAVFQRAV